MRSDASVYKINRWRRGLRLECAVRLYCKGITRPNLRYYNFTGPMRSTQRPTMKRKVQKHRIITNGGRVRLQTHTRRFRISQMVKKV
ncbi:hypothetical protein Y032_0044g972 [Ancylostoma ceylanicum]|uniref:Uncharacterized protein n=1 Tax=Ancylostoma ceylanicum TaxID=53326 RepID=A0A016UFL2_9BILA|nr:hypothetical protein Y032_0044g972 [Ancylostoma ceylanicum]